MINFNYSNGLIIGAIDGEPFQIKVKDIEKVSKLVRLAEKYNKADSDKQRIKKKINKIINPAEGFVTDYPDWIIKNNNLYLKSDETQTPVPGLLCDKIKSFLDKGESVTSFKLFWESCLRNPRFEAIQELAEFLDQNSLTMTTDGGFIGKKKVTLQSGEPVPNKYEGWYMDGMGYIYNESGFDVDEYSQDSVEFREYLNSVRFVATHDKRTSYKVGEWTRIPREECTFDPNESCGSGLHLGSDSYVESFGGQVVIVCITYPEYVTSVPRAESAHKLRCHALKTIGIASINPLSDGNFNY